MPASRKEGFRLEQLNEFASHLLEAESESEVAWIIARQAIAHLDFDDCVIYLVDDDKQHLFQAAAHGPKNPVERKILDPIVIPIGSGIVGSAAQTKKKIRVGDVRLDPRYIEDDQFRLSELAVPMIYKGSCIGVVYSEHAQKDFFTQAHEDELNTVAALGAARIVHIRSINSLKEESQRFQKLVESASDIVFRADIRGYFTYVNPVAIHLTGYSEQELLGMQFFELVTEDQRNLVSRFYRSQVRRKEASTYLEFRIQTKKGDFIWIGQNLQLLFESDKLVGFQAIARDISVVKYAQSAVSRSESNKRAILNASLDGVISVDTKGRIIEFNPAAEKIFGFSMEEAFGRTLAKMIIPPEYRDAHRVGMKRLVSTRVPKLIGQRIEVPALRKDGTQFPIELTLIELETDQGLQFTAFVRDITERKENEEALKEARALAERNADAKTQFLSSMSHEIRTPLNAVIGISHLLVKTDLSVKQKGYVTDVQLAANNLLGLINNILDFQKIDEGHLELEQVVFDLKDLLEELIGRARYLAIGKQVAVQLNVAADTPEWVKSDPIRIAQIISNLVNNAIKFTEQGFVTIDVSVVSSSKKASVVCFSISDSGIGVPDESIDKIFYSFAQASSNTTRKYGGTGLGLPIVKRLVNLFQGEIQVKSEVNVGTEFRVSIPVGLATKKETRTTQSFSQKGNLSGVQILLVEDNPVNQFVAKEILQTWNAETTIASSGKEAIEYLSTQSFNLVLMDIQMPDMDGFQTTAYIRNELLITSEILPIIALTASALNAQRERAISVGMDDFVLKPFDPSFLYARISSALNARNIRFGSGLKKQKAALNWDYFNDNYGNSESLKLKIIQVLTEQIPLHLEVLHDALSNKDAGAVCALAHKIRPSAAMVGAHKLESVCIQLDECKTLKRGEQEALSLGPDFLKLLEELGREISSISS